MRGLTEVSWVERRCQGESRRYPVDGADLGEVHAILTPGTGAKRRFLGPNRLNSNNLGEVVPRSEVISYFYVSYLPHSYCMIIFAT